MRPPLRPFVAADHAQALALWRRTPGVGLSAADAEQPVAAFLARNSGLSFVAQAGPRLVGTILCGHDGRRGMIYHLAVDTDHRRQGLASALLAASIAGLRALGIEKAHLTVFRNNPEGLAFWARAAVARHELALFSVPAFPHPGTPDLHSTHPPRESGP
jgi:ribosomal protein S18 acetylase RimI-like enzyme